MFEASKKVRFLQPVSPPPSHIVLNLEREIQYSLLNSIVRGASGGQQAAVVRAQSPIH